MMKYKKYYESNGTTCTKLPTRRYNDEYLVRNNYLSEYSSEVEKERVLENLGVLLKIQEIRDLIDSITIEGGNYPFDQQPTEGHTGYVLSSDAIYRALQNYSNKQTTNQQITELQNSVQNIISNYLQKNNLKTITLNGTVISLEGNGTVVIDTTGGGETPQQEVFTLELKANPSSINFNEGDVIPPQAITLTPKAKVNGSEINPSLLTNVTINGSAIQNTYTITDTTTFTLQATYNGQTKTASVTVKINIIPKPKIFYIGFGEEDVKPEGFQNNEQWKSFTLDQLYQGDITNPQEDWHLWVLIPKNISNFDYNNFSVSTDRTGIFAIEFEEFLVDDDYYYYQSVLGVTAQTTKYYIHYD